MTDKEIAQDLLDKLRVVPHPPRYAKALCVQRKKMQTFANKFNINNGEHVRRMVLYKDDVEMSIEELTDAARLAPNSKAFPIAIIPSGIWETILGKDVKKVDDGEHWPLDRREGPITWK